MDSKVSYGFACINEGSETEVSDGQTHVDERHLKMVGVGDPGRGGADFRNAACATRLVTHLAGR